MAGHSKFKNIQHRKGAQDKKRAKIFTKLVKEIITATKLAGPDPVSNPRLRSAISAARSQNLPKERIEKGISQGSDTTNTQDYVEIRYEGFAPGGIAIIVEALTDSKNRTASDVRAAFTKFGGNLGETGSVSFMFEHVGFIEYAADNISAEEMLEAAIDAGARDVESNEATHMIFVDIENFNNCVEFLHNKFGNKFGVAIDSYIGWNPHNVVVIDDKEKAEKLLKLIDMLEDSDDVQQVFGNYEISDQVMTKL